MKESQQAEQLIKMKSSDMDEIGKKFEDFKVKDTKGKDLSVGMLKGKVVLVDFWATWCETCMQEMPQIRTVYNKYHEKGFEIIGVSLDTDESQFVTTIENFKMKWPQFFDGQYFQNELAEKYNVSAVPVTYLIDKKGVIFWKGIGSEQLADAVEKLLARK